MQESLKQRSWALPKVVPRKATRAERLNIESDLDQKLSLKLSVDRLYEFTYNNPFFGDYELQKVVQKQTPFHPLSTEPCNVQLTNPAVFFQDKINKALFVPFSETDLRLANSFTEEPEAVVVLRASNFHCNNSKEVHDNTEAEVNLYHQLFETAGQGEDSQGTSKRTLNNQQQLSKYIYNKKNFLFCNPMSQFGSLPLRRGSVK